MEPEEEEDEAGEVFGPDGRAGSLETVGRVDQTALSEETARATSEGDRTDAAGVFCSNGMGQQMKR
jgi:hypothetical protein